MLGKGLLSVKGEKMLEKLFLEMIAYYSGDPKRIQHFTKVHSYAKLIAQMENVDDQSLFIIETAALTHDIGIHICEEKYGECGGKLQEKEGPAIAAELLERLGFDSEVSERVQYLIAHHHTYSNIDGIDYQILVEADFLVNYFEDDLDKEHIRKSAEKIFKTETGKKIVKEMFFPETFQKSETWAQDALQDLEDFIEEQGIYIRQ